MTLAERDAVDFIQIDGLEIGVRRTLGEIFPLAAIDKKAVFENHKAVCDPAKNRWAFPSIVQYVGKVTGEVYDYPPEKEPYKYDIKDMDAFEHYGMTGFWTSETHLGPKQFATEDYIAKNGA
jgi:hypothetical protein